MMILIWIAAFVVAPKINYSHIPPFLRRGTKLQSLHGLILISFVCMILIDGTLMPLHFLDLSESCVIQTSSYISAQSTLSNFFAMQVLLLFVTIPLCLMVSCRKISQTVTLLAMVIFYVSMLFIVYLACASYYYLWLVGLQSYSLLQSVLSLVVVCIPLIYMLIVFIKLTLIIRERMIKCIKKRK